MTAPLHERLAEAAKAADSWPWVTEPRGGNHIYTDHRDENGNGIQCPAIGIHPDHSPWQETKDFILLAQPANVAKLCEQVRVMKEALEGAYAMAIGHAATYQFQHGLDDMHPTHHSVLNAARSALEMVKKQ